LENFRIKSLLLTVVRGCSNSSSGSRSGCIWSWRWRWSWWGHGEWWRRQTTAVWRTTAGDWYVNRSQIQLWSLSTGVLLSSAVDGVSMLLDW